MQVFQTNCLDTARDVLTSQYGSMRLGNWSQPVSMRIEQAELGPVRFDHATFRMRFTAEVEPLGALFLGHVRSGGARYVSSDHDIRCQAGDVFLAAQPDEPLSAVVVDADLELAVLPSSLLSRVADPERSRAPGPVRLLSYSPVSRVAGERWKRVYRQLRDRAAADPGLADRPLVVVSACDLLATVTLETFPSTARLDPLGVDRHDAHPATLRRALAFIEANPHRDISVADIAQAASVSVRAVQLAFRRHLDTTPMSQLRRVRLHHAHEELLAANPDHGDTVATVAARWGFSNPGRFAASYRRLYGVAPGDTLNA